MNRKRRTIDERDACIRCEVRKRFHWLSRFTFKLGPKKKIRKKERLQPKREGSFSFDAPVDGGSV